MARQRWLGGGELEAAVMEILWDRGGWLTPGEVHGALREARPLAYNTVLTVLVRLWRKERVERQRDGRAYAYRPVLGREEYAAVRMEQVLGEAKNRPAALASFLETLSERDRTQLRRLLDRLTRRR